MRVDRATLNDLSILDPDGEGVSLFALLDRTCTRAGKARLRARMRALPATQHEQQETQDAVKHLIGSGEALRQAITALLPDEVETYLDLKWQGLTARSAVTRFVERLVLRLRYRDALRQIREGVDVLRNVLDAIPALIEMLGPASVLLSRHARDLNALLEQDAVCQIRRHGGARSLRDILENDRLARGEAANSVRRYLAILADLDALATLAVVTKEYGWNIPEIVDEVGVVELRGLRHPFLATGKANDVVIEGHLRVVALTGPNMAGKSTTLRAVGVSVYLAHLGCGVPAMQARISRFECLMSSLTVRDSLGKGESFYLSEVRRIRELVTLLEASPRVFALLDEPFKGTNVHDATDATALLLDGLCAQSESTVILATHLATVIESRVDDPALLTSYLNAVEGPAGPVFDYALLPGVSQQRLGMALLQREGVMSALQRAIERRDHHVPLA